MPFRLEITYATDNRLHLHIEKCANEIEADNAQLGFLNFLQDTKAEFVDASLIRERSILAG